VRLVLRIPRTGGDDPAPEPVPDDTDRPLVPSY
jgi:hypothetical protein